jgi:hypothetical protein
MYLLMVCKLVLGIFCSGVDLIDQFRPKNVFGDFWKILETKTKLNPKLRTRIFWPF